MNITNHSWCFIAANGPLNGGKRSPSHALGKLIEANLIVYTNIYKRPTTNL